MCGRDRGGRKSNTIAHLLGDSGDLERERIGLRIGERLRLRIGERLGGLRARRGDLTGSNKNYKYKLNPVLSYCSSILFEDNF